MAKYKYVRSALGGCVVAGLFFGAAFARNFNIPAEDLKTALDAYGAQAGVQLMYPEDAVRGARSNGVKGDLPMEAALSRLLSGTGFSAHRAPSGAIGIMRDEPRADEQPLTHIAAAPVASASGTALETVTVTSSKIGGDVQNIPISITALSQEQLTATQTAGGPDLVKQVPNLTFSKTNFTGYNIEIRGIGTQAISVTTDPAVAVAFNDIPFIRNHFFEQEFYDLSQAEVLRGPQGTLYGRNATAGVVNIVSAKPTDQFEAMASADIGNYQNRRLEGMINIPVLDDRVDIRVAGEWTKRNGYSFNELTDASIDGRDLWSGRLSIGVKPVEDVQVNFVWEHFSEDDDRMRTSKQLCKTAPIPTEIDGVPITNTISDFGSNGGYLSQGCLPTSLYGADSFQVPNGFALPYYNAFTGGLTMPITPDVDPYASAKQSRDLRVIESALNPVYKAKNDVVELNTDYAVTPSLTFTSQTGFNHDFLWSTEDYNRFNTQPGIFSFAQGSVSDDYATLLTPDPVAGKNGVPADTMMFCDPQLGCSDRLVAEDLSSEHAWQLSQEFRLASNFSGPVNFSVGGNYLHYETEENYYVFVNTLTLFAARGNADLPWFPGVSDNSTCMPAGLQYGNPNISYPPILSCIYIDPNPISRLNGNGHNYFASKNPYTLNSYAGFGEIYYNVLRDLKLTAGLRFTEDQKHFPLVPSWLVVSETWGYPVTGVVNQSWSQFSGRFATNWSPKLDFTDQTLLYGSYAHGYKAGGANPPGAVLVNYATALGTITNPVHPLTFKPEFIDAFEVGTKNTLLDGTLTLNADTFYYNYENYQISEIVDRTSINLNFDAHVDGAEIESTWEPLPGLRFSLAGGLEHTQLAEGSQSVDLIDRTAGHSGWAVVKPFVTQASNCVLPDYVVLDLMKSSASAGFAGVIAFACGEAYSSHFDPITNLPYKLDPKFDYNGDPVEPGYVGFDPVDPNAANNGAGPAPNNGQGFDKNLSGNELPNAPHFTTSLSAEYTMPVSENWAATAHSDFYWQGDSWARVFNDNPYDKLHGYTTLNLALILTSQTGWQVMGYVKNVFDTTAITGTFLNSDDSGLTTNVFLTDPRLFGVRVTKNW
jgi:iron complex outermembrane receptor protein